MSFELADNEQKPYLYRLTPDDERRVEKWDGLNWIGISWHAKFEGAILYLAGIKIEQKELVYMKTDHLELAIQQLTEMANEKEEASKLYENIDDLEDQLFTQLEQEDDNEENS